MNTLPARVPENFYPWTRDIMRYIGLPFGQSVLVNLIVRMLIVGSEDSMYLEILEDEDREYQIITSAEGIYIRPRIIPTQDRLNYEALSQPIHKGEFYFILKAFDKVMRVMQQCYPALNISIFDSLDDLDEKTIDLLVEKIINELLVCQAIKPHPTQLGFYLLSDTLKQQLPIVLARVTPINMLQH